MINVPVVDAIVDSICLFYLWLCSFHPLKLIFFVNHSCKLNVRNLYLLNVENKIKKHFLVLIQFDHSSTLTITLEYQRHLSSPFYPLVEDIDRYKIQIETPFTTIFFFFQFIHFSLIRKWSNYKTIHFKSFFFFRLFIQH